MFRVAIISKSGEHKSENFDTREKVDEYILNNEAIRFLIAKNRVIIETDKGVRK